jgi:hypothetical protein
MFLNSVTELFTIRKKRKQNRMCVDIDNFWKNQNDQLIIAQKNKIKFIKIGSQVFNHEQNGRNKQKILIK